MKQIHINNLDEMDGKTIKFVRPEGYRVGYRDGVGVLHQYPNPADILGFHMTDGSIYHIKIKSNFVEEITEDR